MMRYLYAVIFVMILAVGWQAWSTAGTWNFLETESAAQAYGASPDKAKVTIIAFYSYTSGASKDVNATVMSSVLENPDTRIIFHPVMSNQLALRAATISIAAGMQGKFIEMHEELLHHDVLMSDDDVRVIADRLKLDADRLLKDAKGDAVLQKLKKEVAAAQKLNIDMTPLFYFNRKTLFGPNSLDTLHNDFIQMIQKARAS